MWADRKSNKLSPIRRMKWPMAKENGRNCFAFLYFIQINKEMWSAILIVSLESILKIAIIENNIQVFGKHKTEPQIMRTKRKQSNNGRVECNYAPNVHNKYAHKLILYGFIDYSLICIRGEQKKNDELNPECIAYIRLERAMFVYFE